MQQQPRQGQAAASDRGALRVVGRSRHADTAVQYRGGGSPILRVLTECRRAPPFCMVRGYRGLRVSLATSQPHRDLGEWRNKPCADTNRWHLARNSLCKCARSVHIEARARPQSSYTDGLVALSGRPRPVLAGSRCGCSRGHEGLSTVDAALPVTVAQKETERKGARSFSDAVNSDGNQSLATEKNQAIVSLISPDSCPVLAGVTVLDGVSIRVIVQLNTTCDWAFPYCSSPARCTGKGFSDWRLHLSGPTQT
eukprot:scaffold1025_cov381-Prasinococcus_capsulatus_cf.AAC.2